MSNLHVSIVFMMALLDCTWFSWMEVWMNKACPLHIILQPDSLYVFSFHKILFKNNLYFTNFKYFEYLINKYKLLWIWILCHIWLFNGCLLLGNLACKEDAIRCNIVDFLMIAGVNHSQLRSCKQSVQLKKKLTSWCLNISDFRHFEHPVAY